MRAYNVAFVEINTKILQKYQTSKSYHVYINQQYPQKSITCVIYFLIFKKTFINRCVFYSQIETLNLELRRKNVYDSTTLHCPRSHYQW